MSAPPRRRFGQNFLQDDEVIEQILDAVDAQPDQHIIEIGPGRGALTLPLLESGCRLDVIELDRDLVAYWNKQSFAAEFHVHQADALKFDYSSVKTSQPIRLVGNLPYNISTPLLFTFLDHHHVFADLHVMLQKEVAERICATHGSRTYGRLTVMLASYFECEMLFDVPPGAFFPEPKVTSTVIRIRVSDNPRFEITSQRHFAHIVKQAFSQRRKTLRKSLKSLVNDEQFELCKIDAGLRPEALSPQDFATLANHTLTDGS